MRPRWFNAGLLMKLGAVVGAGILASVLVPTSSYDNATTILASFAGVVVAALVPTMILAATILRPVSKGKNEFNAVRDAVSKQISFFSGLFLLTLMLAALIFAGSLFGWDDVTVYIQIPGEPNAGQIPIPIVRVVGGSVVALAALIAVQMTGFVHGIKSLFALHADNAERELDRIIRDQNDVASTAVLPKDPRAGIGENIGEIKH